MSHCDAGVPVKGHGLLRRSVGQNFVGLDVTGAGAERRGAVVGQDVTGAWGTPWGRTSEDVTGAKSLGQNVVGQECHWGRTSLGQYPWGSRSVGQEVLGQEVGNQQLNLLYISRKTQSVPPARKDTWLSVSFYCAIL